MMDRVLDRLQSLEAELAAIDPAHKLDVAAMVAAMASALRDALAGVDAGRQAPVSQTPMDVRRAG